MRVVKEKVQSSPFKTLLSAIKKLSAEEKQLLRMELFSADALAEMRAFEARLKKKKAPLKKTDDEIVKLTTFIRNNRYANNKKMLH
ncbi:hypothetical protein [Terrimonas alba]|uniref:hypothetical protein n=1 Tax=Terrimonas alba TaxID=3349636 RepID=UPI0035F38983